MAKKSKSGIDKKELAKQEKELIRQQADKLIEIGTQVNETIRKRATQKFFHDARHIPVNGQGRINKRNHSHDNIMNSLNFHYSTRWYSRSGHPWLQIKFFSEIDLDKYIPPRSLSSQVEKGYYPDLGTSPSEYVLNNQWEDGIVALPKIFTWKTLVNGQRVEREGDERYNRFFLKNERSMKNVVEGAYRFGLRKEWNKKSKLKL